MHQSQQKPPPAATAWFILLTHHADLLPRCRWDQVRVGQPSPALSRTWSARSAAAGTAAAGRSHVAPGGAREPCLWRAPLRPAQRAGLLLRGGRPVIRPTESESPLLFIRAAPHDTEDYSENPLTQRWTVVPSPLWHSFCLTPSSREPTALRWWACHTWIEATSHTLHIFLYVGALTIQRNLGNNSAMSQHIFFLLLLFFGIKFQMSLINSPFQSTF